MTKDTRVTIHIGLHKTGSTAIQHYLWRHGLDLLQSGVYYPATGRPASEQLQFGHHDIPWGFTPEGTEPPDRTLERLRREIEATTMPEVILSSEEFSRIDPAVIPRLAAALPFPTRVLFYYRRQSEIVQGLYATDVLHNGERRDIADYADNFTGPLDFSRLARRWMNVYGREAVVARAYRPASFPDGNIVPDFLSALNIHAPTPRGETFHYNVSLPWFAVLSVLRLRRIHVPDPAIARVVESFDIIFRNQPSRPALMSPAEANRFDRRFAESNAAFIAEFAEGQPPIEPFPDDGEEDFQLQRLGLWPEIEQTLRAAADHVRALHETGQPPMAERAA